MTADVPQAPQASDGEAEQAEPPQRLIVDVVIEDERWTGLGDVEAWVRAAAEAVYDGIEDCAGTAALALDSDAAVRALNKQFREIDKPTNVLSFPTGEEVGGHFGDIIMARETVEREAAELGIPLAHHVQHLVVHGLLHLFGHDHMTPAEAEEMEDLERTLLATLGIADPYADTDPI